jgi:phage tail-like protein
MAVIRERPYGRFNFLLSWDGLDDQSVQAGFMEVTGLGLQIEVVEYRAGNHPSNAPIKITGLQKVSDVTLKRGVIGSLDLYQWLDEVRNGSQDVLRAVTIKLLSETRDEVAQQWKLTNARPIKYMGPTLNASSSTDVAIEELTLSCEGIELA